MQISKPINADGFYAFFHVYALETNISQCVRIAFEKLPIFVLVYCPCFDSTPLKIRNILYFYRSSNKLLVIQTLSKTAKSYWSLWRKYYTGCIVFLYKRAVTDDTATALYVKVWFCYLTDLFLTSTVVTTAPKPLTNNSANHNQIMLLSPVCGD